MAKCTSCGKQAGFGSTQCRKCDVRERGGVVPTQAIARFTAGHAPNRQILLRIEGDPLLAGSFGEELTVTNRGVEARVVRGFLRIEMTLPFDRVAQVNLARGVFAAQLEIVNKGGQDSIVVRGLQKYDAEEAKRVIETYLAQSTLDGSSSAGVSIADELRKLADLRDAGVLSDTEFQRQKARLLG